MVLLTVTVFVKEAPWILSIHHRWKLCLGLKGDLTLFSSTSLSLQLGSTSCLQDRNFTEYREQATTSPREHLHYRRRSSCPRLSCSGRQQWDVTKLDTPLSSRNLFCVASWGVPAFRREWKRWSSRCLSLLKWCPVSAHGRAFSQTCSL